MRKPFLLSLLALLLILPLATLRAEDTQTGKLRDRVRNELEKELDFGDVFDDLEPAAVEIAPPGGPVNALKIMKLVRDEQVQKDLEWLAHDEREGRNAGYLGADLAATYLADRFKGLGLRPGGDNGTYFQNFTFPVRGRQKLERDTKNVIAILPGGDHEFADEVVIVGAHYDHVGRHGQANSGRMSKPKGDDEIWNGADDNASGTAGLVGVAEAIMRSGMRPKRTIIFIAFSAEEHGLLGSKYYCENPVRPIEKTAAMINMDMIGRNGDNPVNISAMGSARVWKTLVTGATEATGLKVEMEDTYRPNSDHAPFIEKAIPTIFITTGLHEDYHQPSDHPELIAWNNVARVVRTCTMLVVNAAELERRPQFESVEQDRGMFGGGPRLGITLEALEAEEEAALGLEDGFTGIRITGTAPKSVADRCGMKEGDVLISFAGEALKSGRPLMQLRRQIMGVEREKPVEIKVIRDGKELVLEATWPKE